MKYTSLVIALSLVLFGCSRRDAQLRKEVLGNWKADSISCAFDADGSFTQTFASHTNQPTQGTWIINDGAIVVTITNSSQVMSGIKDRLEIARVGDGQLVIIDTVNGHTNLLVR